MLSACSICLRVEFEGAGQPDLSKPFPPDLFQLPEVPALKCFREIAIVNDDFGEPINLP